MNKTCSDTKSRWIFLLLLTFILASIFINPETVYAGEGLYRDLSRASRDGEAVLFRELIEKDVL